MGDYHLLIDGNMAAGDSTTRVVNPKKHWLIAHGLQKHIKIINRAKAS